MPRKPEQTNEHYLLGKLDYLSTLSRSDEGARQLNRGRTPTLALHQESDTARDSFRSNRKSEPARQTEASAEHFDISRTATHQVVIDGVEFWLRGSSLLCRCPTCRAPMTIQTWLGLADCWQCQTSIALTEEQLAAAKNLPANLELPLRSQLTSAAPATTNRNLKLPTEGWPSIDEPIRLRSEFENDPHREELERLARGSRLVRIVRRGMRITPAWLISMLVHLILILILALIVFNDSSLVERITLSTFLSAEKELGGKLMVSNPEFQVQDDLELASRMVEGEQELRKALQKASEDAAELTRDPGPETNLPDLLQARQNITNRPDQLMSFAARDPRVRSEIVAKEGGTTLTEASVARALRWLVSVQNRDGSWSLANFDNHANPRNKGDVMGTSLALLPLLGAGQTHEYGIYKQSVAAGLAWLIENQLADGDLRAGVSDDAGMYAHGQASIVLCEALALTGDEQFRKPAQLAIQFIEEAQHRDGGWRYQPGQPGDTSVFGWQMMALQSARAPNLNLTVSDETLRLADYFLDSVATQRGIRRDLPEGATYAYQQNREATPAMTAEAILCRMYLGWDRNDPRLSQSVKWMIQNHPPRAAERELYYWYYATQVMHHYGGKPWQTWNSRMREILIASQQTKGRHPGSWDTNLCTWGSRGGRIYTTSLACCILEVYYRHLPLFNQIETTTNETGE